MGNFVSFKSYILVSFVLGQMESQKNSRYYLYVMLSWIASGSVPCAWNVTLIALWANLRGFFAECFKIEYDTDRLETSEDKDSSTISR